VQNLRFLVEFLADPVAAEFAHHAVALAFRVLLDDRAHVAEKGSGENFADAQPHALVGGLAQSLGLYRGLPT